MKMDYKTTTQHSGTTATDDERALLACWRAKSLEEAGEFESARQELAQYWLRIGDRPSVHGLSDLARADILLRAGNLSSVIGSLRQIPGAQEAAKDLISESIRIFEDLNSNERVAEARIDLATCYWRVGAFDEARVSLDEALVQLGDIESEQRLRALLNKANVERATKRYDEALRIHRSAAPLFEFSDNNALRGKFHNEYASVLKNVGLARNREDYIDQSLVEYSAASFHAELSGDKRFLASVENNVGFLFVQLGRYREAKTHLDRARSLFTILKDRGNVAQVDDTRARALIGRGRFARAETLSRTAVQVLEEGDELSILAEALTTYATALARLGNFSKARATFERAIRTAHSAGDAESGGVAALSMVEELVNQLPFNDLIAYYRMAESALVDSQRADSQTRLNQCARMLLGSKSLSFTPRPESSIATTLSDDSRNETTQSKRSLDEQVLQYEGELIRQALEAANGSITRASRVLGITHQGLAFILNGRHKTLLTARKPAKPRRRSIMRH